MPVWSTKAPITGTQKCTKEVSTMAASRQEPENLGVLMLDFSPVVREGLPIHFNVT
jgi:hypothetical protein